MHNMATPLSFKEQRIIMRIDQYFKNSNMSLYEKIFNAKLIAEYDLEGHHFDNDYERRIISDFQDTLANLLVKLSYQNP